ncbi:tumor necrosis factor ligand superfamily member 14-like, partial [Arapaima gigas]
ITTCTLPRISSMTSGMGNDKVASPPVFVVDSQAHYLPPLGPLPHQPAPRHTLLYVLVTLAIAGMAVEACFIYHLYQQGSLVKKRDSENPKRNKVEVKPPKPSAHLISNGKVPIVDGILMWETEGGDSFTYEMDHIGGKLYIKKEGFYFIYSKVFFSDPRKNMFTHSVMKISPRLPGTNQEVMRSRRYISQAQDPGNMLNSYLGGIFLLHEGEAIFVVVHNHTLLRRQLSADNFFGAYMI